MNVLEILPSERGNPSSGGRGTPQQHVFEIIFGVTWRKDEKFNKYPYTAKGSIYCFDFNKNYWPAYIIIRKAIIQNQKS